MTQHIVKAIWNLKRSKGIKYPYFIFIFLTMISAMDQIENLKLIGENAYKYTPDNNQYVMCFIFIAFSRYTINKTNLTYLLSKFSGQNTLNLSLFLNLALTTIFTFTYISIHFALINLYDLSIELNVFLKLIINIFLYALFFSFFSSFALNLKNKYSTLFILYFSPIIIGLINLVAIKVFKFNLKEIIHINFGDHTIKLLLLSTAIFIVLSIITKRSYFFNHE